MRCVVVGIEYFDVSASYLIMLKHPELSPFISIAPKSQAITLHWFIRMYHASLVHFISLDNYLKSILYKTHNTCN